MKNKILVILALIIVAVVALASFGYLPLEFFVDTNTKAYKPYESWSPEHSPAGSIPPELTDETELVTAWKPNGNSVKLAIQGNIMAGGDAFPGCNAFDLGYYYYKIYIKDTEHADWFEIMWKDNYNRDIIHITQPSTGFLGRAPFAGLEYLTDTLHYLIDDKGVKSVGYKNAGTAGWRVHYIGNAYALEIKNPHVGALKVEFWVEVENAWSPTDNDMRALLMEKDEVKLLDGTGDLKVINAQSVYEDGETIKFSLDTGYSGKRQGGEYADDGWELRIYDGSGTQVKTYSVPDNKHPYEISYPIPTGSYKSTGKNTWKAELWNTLFNQKETYFFVIGPGMRQKIPGIPTITLDKSVYAMGDTCSVTVSSVPNPVGTNTIYEFFVKAYYADTQEYLYSPNYILASGNSASFSFSVTRGDRYFTVEANAFDTSHSSGGLASETGKKTVYAQDKNPAPNTYTLTVFVTYEGDPVDRAKVSVIGDQTDIENAVSTDTSGKASFIGLAQDTYNLVVSKEGYQTTSKSVIMDKDKTITIGLSETSDLWSIISAVVIFVIFCIAGLLIPVPVLIKILIVMVGLVIAAISYLYFSGLI